jgi:phage gp36-like protein
MAYVTIIELKKYLPEQTIMQLTDDENVGQICQEIVDEAIANAQALIDVYMRGRYPAEIADADVPPFIADMTAKVACYNLYRRKISLTMPEVITNEYKDCLSMLRDIQSGKVTPFPVVSEPTVIICNRTDVDKDFSESVWDTY